MLRRLFFLSLSVGLIACLGCAQPSENSAKAANEPATKVGEESLGGENNPAFQDKLLAIARVYPVYQRVHDQSPAMMLRWAVRDCEAPPAPPPPNAWYSRSSDEATHGRKMYSLFARYHNEYLRNVDTPGQVVVKESWLPVEVKDESAGGYVGGVDRREPIDVPTDLSPYEKASVPTPHTPDRRMVAKKSGFNPYLKVGDKTYKAARQGDLFIMYHVDPATPGTDNGWVYGTVTPDGKTVTSAGRVASCMRCHQSLSGRLFGHRY
jgi:hypothetical protein